MLRTLTPLLLALGLSLPHTAQAQFDPDPDTNAWKLECTSTSCPQYSRIAEILSGAASEISSWYRGAGFPIPRVDRTARGTIRLIHMVPEPDNTVCG